MTTQFDPKQSAFYANFIKLAVEMYESNPKSLEPETPADFPSENFEIIAYIKATQIFLNKETLTYLKETVFFGYVARSRNRGTKADSNQIIIAIRGTQSLDEWKENVRFEATEFQPIPEAGKVEDGFFGIYNSLRFTEQDTNHDKKPLEFISEYVKNHNDINLIIAGHSLGATLATMLALHVGHEYADINDRTVLYSFGSPAFGCKQFANYFDKTVKHSFRIWHRMDIVVPLLDLKYTQIKGEELELSWKQKTTILINSNLSPIYGHIVPTYLWLLDPETYPLRQGFSVPSDLNILEETIRQIELLPD